ncbi:MAG: DUF1906 domain-containing protein [Actinophytocola sp.]|nr:DUF1906 domain-containing protein [Actinophytocola sp.]
MTIAGVDYSWARPDPACLYKSGFRFAVRYVSYSTTGKSMTAAEVKRLTAAGLSVVTVWQQGAKDALGGFDLGAQYARDAEKMHRAVGGPSPAPIYFAVDFDAGEHQLPACYAYLRGAASVLGWSRVGVYGSVRVIRYMADKGVRSPTPTSKRFGRRTASSRTTTPRTTTSSGYRTPTLPTSKTRRTRNTPC